MLHFTEQLHVILSTSKLIVHLVTVAANCFHKSWNLFHKAHNILHYSSDTST